MTLAAAALIIAAAKLVILILIWRTRAREKETEFSSNWVAFLKNDLNRKAHNVE